MAETHAAPPAETETVSPLPSETPTAADSATPGSAPAFVPPEDFGKRVAALAFESMRRAGLERSFGLVEIALSSESTWLGEDKSVQLGALAHPLSQDKSIRPEQLQQSLALITVYLRGVLQAPVKIPEDLNGPLGIAMATVLPDQTSLIRFMEEVEQRLAALTQAPAKRPSVTAPQPIEQVAAKEQQVALKERVQAAFRKPITYLSLASVLVLVGLWVKILFLSGPNSLSASLFAEVASVKEVKQQGGFASLVITEAGFDQLPRDQQEEKASQLLAKIPGGIQTFVIRTAKNQYMVSRAGDKVIISASAPITAPQTQ